MTRFFTVFLLSISSCFACGPWIPEAYVLRNDDVFYAPPEVGFAAELKYLIPEGVPYAAVLDEVLSPEMELAEVLASSGLDADAQVALLAEYREFRQVLNKAKDYLDRQEFEYYQPPVDEIERAEALAAFEALSVPSALPETFQYYLDGALAYYKKDFDAARVHWQALLDLPEPERQTRAVMAAYMIGKLGEADTPKYFQLVRALVAQGYTDTQGLAAASYGREARYYLYDSNSKERYRSAIRLYLQQWGAGYSNASWSLGVTAREAFENADAAMLHGLVRDADARAVLTAYLMTECYGESTNLQRFLSALPSPDALTLKEAGRFALIEYQQNNISATRLWLQYADAQDGLALWVRSKLLLRDGRIEEGRTLMLALTTEMDAGRVDWRRVNTEHAWGELGLLMLREKSFVQAADCFNKSGSWEDCAYVLERVLYVDELIAWGKQLKPVDPDAVHSDFDGAHALIARRLMREGRFDAALEFFDPEVQTIASEYVAAMRGASDSKADAASRARQYWAAARLMRDYGMSLVGSELAPDFAWHGGSFEWGDTYEERAENYYEPNFRLNQMTWEESKRAAATVVRPNKRFHYRYRAAQLAELAAGLLPNNDEDAARIYCQAGDWLRLRDPETADRCYKLLVVRCPETELGAAAAEVNWFPEVDLALFEPFAE
ncbi:MULTISPECIES: hypothetical protein [unclassified Lentimonas]|uniref:hypothetical protein n=1 Tax=unclassified Lentimonas TaxID=2630993 RepID=UPI00132B6084|nr:MULTISPECIES: hypothetical protein [unclassified Lentimonas]CAA6689925.1 Unannotated [Lentimonas sp. CC10]CAA6690978.1 Unannotated [Lentimonas sp. CC19]CAA7069383.1 Unannotated [Lentimonas sp. CC11]